MNNENKPSVIAELTAALASMAERAAAAEAEAEQYKKSSGEWYQFFTSKDKELRDTQAELQKAREALEAKEGEQNHGNDKEATAVPTTEPEAPAVTLDELEGMDMNMFDAEETESAPRPVWRITDDGCADWACRKIAEEKTELDRITALGESQIEKIQQRIDAAQRRYENGTRFLTGKLAEYFETVPHKTTKTKHSYRLLSGTLVKKIGGNTMKQDDDTLLAYLKASGNEDMIQNTEKPKWGEFKKRLEIVGGQIVDKTTGELVEGVQIIEKPDTFTVDV